MTKSFKSLLLATLPAAMAVAAPQAVFAQAAGPSQGVAIADLEEAIAKSNAGVLATNQIQLTYKAQIDAAQSRATALNTELGNMRNAIATAQKAPNPNQAALQQQIQAYQKREADAQQELANLSRPFQMATVYAREQIALKLEQASRNAMQKKKIALLLKPEAAILNSTGADITADVIAELNTLVPNVGITPPAGWQPGGQQAAPPSTGQPARPAQPAPSGR